MRSSRSQLEEQKLNQISWSQPKLSDLHPGWIRTHWILPDFVPAIFPLGCPGHGWCPGPLPASGEGRSYCPGSPGEPSPGGWSPEVQTANTRTHTHTRDQRLCVCMCDTNIPRSLKLVMPFTHFEFLPGFLLLLLSLQVLFVPVQFLVSCLSAAKEFIQNLLGRYFICSRSTDFSTWKQTITIIPCNVAKSPQEGGS